MGDLEELTALIRRFVDERDWRAFHNAKDLAAAISIEASELQEAFLWKTGDEAHEMMADPASRSAVEEEMADILIYLLSMASTYDIDLKTAVERKVASNSEKYPADRVRGRAVKYDRLER
jgi:NTP pyrophosphatase (non-canonical NTP hydrolase)